MRTLAKVSRTTEINAADVSTNGGGYSHIRRYVRAQVQLPVQYSREEGSGFGRSDESASAEAIDLGGGGVRLATDEDLPLGTVLLLRFRLPNVDHEMVMRGRIVLSFYKADVKRFFHGIAFTQIDPADQAHIIQYVEERARAAGS